MEDELIEEIIKLKTDMVISSTKYSISGSEDQNDRAVLDSVVASWLESVDNAQNLREKYEAFMEMDQFLKKSSLFVFIQSVLSDKNADFVQYIILLYKRLIQDSKYQELSSKCGYQLSEEFGNEECYYDGTLQRKISFYYSFREKINSIYSELLKKGVFKK